jgi:hypothetical protein
MNKLPSLLYIAVHSGTFLKLETYHSLRMPYSWYKFGCDRSIIDTFLKEQTTYSDIPRNLLERYF